MANTRQAYLDLVDNLKKLGGILGPALSVQFEAPPGSGTMGEHGISDPTLSAVVDPRRLALSEEIAATHTALRAASEIFGRHAAALHQAVARWEGQEGSTRK